MLRQGDLTGAILGAAVAVHTALGPGLLESAYEDCLGYELMQRRIPFQRQVPLTVAFNGVQLSCTYRLDFVVANEVVVELKSVERLLPIHEA